MPVNHDPNAQSVMAALATSDPVVVRVPIAGFGQATVLSLKVARVGAWPPQAGDLDGVFGITEVARTIAPVLLVPFLALQETLDTTDLCAEARGKTRPIPGMVASWAMTGRV